MGLKDTLGSMHRRLGKHAAVVHAGRQNRKSTQRGVSYYCAKIRVHKTNGEGWLADVAWYSARTFSYKKANV
jgi:hypothetical protein